MTESVETDVAIVGAGLAGLVAARRIAAGGARPLVIEARDRVGGRLLNEEIGDGKVVEVGGQWIGPTRSGSPPSPLSSASAPSRPTTRAGT
jgi:monoamine oxidase